MIYYSNNDYRDYLAHHGVVGMHWGIRRYQPYSVRPRGSGKGGKEIGEAKALTKSINKAVKSAVKSGQYAPGANDRSAILNRVQLHLSNEQKARLSRARGEYEYAQDARDSAFKKDYETALSNEKFINEFRKEMKRNLDYYKSETIDYDDLFPLVMDDVVSEHVQNNSSLFKNSIKAAEHASDVHDSYYREIKDVSKELLNKYSEASVPKYRNRYSDIVEEKIRSQAPLNYSFSLDIIEEASRKKPKALTWEEYKKWSDSYDEEED